MDCRTTTFDTVPSNVHVLVLIKSSTYHNCVGVQTVAVSAATNVLAVMTARCVEVYSCLNGKWQYCLDNYQNSSIIFVVSTKSMLGYVAAASVVITAGRHAVTAC